MRVHEIELPIVIIHKIENEVVFVINLGNSSMIR